MNIESVKSDGVYPNKGASKISGNKAAGSASAKDSVINKTEDKLTLSSEARELQHVMSRLSSGYYDKKSVIEETAGKILNSLENE